MRKMISLIFAAGLLASGFAAAAETIGTAHVDGRHGGGGHSGNGHVVRGGGGNRAGNVRNGRIRYGVGLRAGLGVGAPYYAGDPGVDAYGGYYDSGNYAAPADTDPGAYGSDDVSADVPVSPVLYYCDNPQGYYSDVTTCNDDWQPVQAAPPAQ